MLVYLAGPQTFLHLCKISDKVYIYLVQVRDVGRSENREGGRVVWLGLHLGGVRPPCPHVSDTFACTLLPTCSSN
jgi:hypothetical protein